MGIINVMNAVVITLVWLLQMFTKPVAGNLIRLVGIDAEYENVEI